METKKMNEINKSNAWYKLGVLFGENISIEELDIFLKKNNLYSTVNKTSDSSFKKDTFQKMCLFLDERNINTAEVKTLYVKWDEVKDHNLNGFDKYSFYWGYDIASMEWITLSEAGEIMNTTSDNLRMAIKNGRIKSNDYKKSGKVWLVRKSAINKLKNK